MTATVRLKEGQPLNTELVHFVDSEKTAMLIAHEHLAVGMPVLPGRIEIIDQETGEARQHHFVFAGFKMQLERKGN